MSSSSTIPEWQIFNRVPNAEAIADGIKDIPPHWSLTPIQDKAPKRDGWEHEPFIPHNTIADLILKGERRTSKKSERQYTAFYSGFGLRTGEQSAGLLAIDVDGASAEPLLQRMSGGDIPLTVGWTSGKPGRRQIVFQIPDEIRPLVASFGRAVVEEVEDLKTAAGEQLEFRYSNHQSCLPPSRHPQTGEYKWVDSPSDVPVAIAPKWLCDKLIEFNNQERQETAHKQQQSEERQRQALERRRERQQLNTIGVTTLEDVLEESLKRLHAEDIYNWSGHNWHYQGDKLLGCCPRHNSTSGKSFHVDTKTLQWYCFNCEVGGRPTHYRYFAQGGNGTPKGQDFVEVLRGLASDAGVQMPERPLPDRDRTISPEEWQYRFGLPNWFRSQLARLPKIFKGFGKPPKTFEPKPLPQTIKYVFGELPSPGQYKALGCPTVRFAPGQRLQLLAELVELGYHDILDSSPTGTSKSHDIGLAETSRFGVDRLWDFSEDHRNPTTPSVEANYTDMPVRNNGLVEDHTRRTALNNPHRRWPRLDEKATTEGNCWRAPSFHTLAAKGYQAEVGAEAKENPVCGSCHMGSSCAGKGESTPQPGASFRSNRRDAFLSSRIRASLNSAPNPKDLEAKVGTSEDGGAEETETNRNAAFLDEAMRQLKSTDAIEVFLNDFDQMFAEIESKLPVVHEGLKPLRLALRPILAGEVAPTKETYHGLNDAAVRASLTQLKEKLFGTEDHTNNRIIPEIIAQLKSIQPNLEEILKEPDGFNKDGVAAKERKGISNETSKFIRSRVRQESYRDIAKELRTLPSNWLIPFLEVWNGSRRGALRINNGVLTVTTRNTRHAEICKAMQWVCYLDATATRDYLALHLDIDPSDIVQIEQEVSPVNNLTIVQVTDLGLAGHGRSDSLKERVAALKPALQGRHPDIAFLEHKAHAVVDDGDGWWFNHNRGSNEYKSRSAIASIGTPYQNIGSLQDLWLTLTGERNVDKDTSNFSKFVQWQTQSEVAQGVGRLRANLRPNENLTYYSCADFDLSFLAQYYPGATIKQEAAVNITPEAGTVGQRTRWAVLQAYRRGIETGKKITQDFLAKEAGVSQGRISQISAEVGGWRVLQKLLASLLESLYRTANNFAPLDDEQKFLADTYLPLVAEEDPPDVVEALLNTVQAYGWQAFQTTLAATPLETRGKLLGALVSGLPPGMRDEFRAMTLLAQEG